MFDPYEIDFDSKVILSNCFEVLQQISVPDRAKVIKMWLHGWATSHRIKGDYLHNCLLGCTDGVDSLGHYLLCPRVFGAASFLLPGTSADPLVRCGLCSTSVQSLHLVACTFSAYHATKHSFLKDFESHASVPTDKYWIYFAQSLSAEAAERRLTNTLFDPSMFKHFLGIDLQT